MNDQQTLFPIAQTLMGFLLEHGAHANNDGGTWTFGNAQVGEEVISAGCRCGARYEAPFAKKGLCKYEQRR